jgi:hypothetical protein
MAIIDNGLKRGFVPGLLDEFWDVELGDDVFVDSRIGRDDFDVQVLPGHTKLSVREA